MIQQFKLETLNDMQGGRINEAWDQAIARAAADCEDRPGVRKPRVVTLTLELTPVLDQVTANAALDSVDGRFKITESVPKRETKGFNLSFRKTATGPALLFNDMSEDDVHQRTIDES